MNLLDEPRVNAVVRVERTALVFRYFIYLVVGGLYLSGSLPGEFLNFLVITAAVLLHNGLVHAVLRSKRYPLFFSWWNLAIYHVEASLIVALTGPDSGEGYIVFLLYIIGASAYMRTFRGMAAVTVLCSVTYIALLLMEWQLHGISVTFATLTIKVLAIVACGLLMARVASILWHTEERAFDQAQALQSSESTLRTILNHAANPIVVFDEEEFMSEANERAGTFLNCSPDALLGQRFRKFVFDDGTWPNKMATLRQRGEYFGEEIFVDEEGDEHTVELRVRSYLRGGKAFFVAVWHDISEQKGLNEATRLANEHVERLSRELAQLGEFRSEFMSAITKSLRSPLSAVLGYVEMLLDEELGDITEEQRKALQTCRRSATRMFKFMSEAEQRSIRPGKSPRENPLNR